MADTGRDGAESSHRAEPPQQAEPPGGPHTPQESRPTEGTMTASPEKATPDETPNPTNAGDPAKADRTGSAADTHKKGATGPDSGKQQGSALRGTARLLGIDFARAIAILGMFAAHVGPTSYEHPQSWAFLPFHGRAAVLFAVLAGISIAMMSGSTEPAIGSGWRKAIVRIASRAGLMIILGLIINYVIIVPVWSILAYYGGFFLLSLPFLRLRAMSLAILSGLIIVVAPVASWMIRSVYYPKNLIETPLNDLSHSQLTSVSGVGEFLVTLMLTGVFPTMIWIGYVLAGMALGRMDLRSASLGRWLTVGGAALAALAYSTSWLALNFFGGYERIYETLQAHAHADGVPVDMYLQLSLFKVHGTPPTDSPAWLLLATAHSGTPFDGAGGVGLSLIVIGLSLQIQHVAHRMIRPLAAVGAISLTCYTGHLVVMQLLWQGDPEHTALNAGLFIVGSVIFAILWRDWYGQGPMEKFVAKVSSAATRAVR